MLKKFSDTINFVNGTVEFLSKFEKKQITFVKIWSQTQKQIQLPHNKLCHGSKLCLFVFKSRDPLKLNITLYNMVYIGTNNTQEYVLSGVAIYDQIGSNYFHTKTYCVVDMFVSSSDVTCVRGKTFYPNNTAFNFKYRDPIWYREPYFSFWEAFSKTNKLLLVFYSYKEYGSFQINISAETTVWNVLHFEQCGGDTRNVLLPWNQECSLFVFTHKERTLCDENLSRYFRISLTPLSMANKKMWFEGYGTIRGQWIRCHIGHFLSEKRCICCSWICMEREQNNQNLFVDNPCHICWDFVIVAALFVSLLKWIRLKHFVLCDCPSHSWSLNCFLFSSATLEKAVYICLCVCFCLSVCMHVPLVCFCACVFVCLSFCLCVPVDVELLGSIGLSHGGDSAVLFVVPSPFGKTPQI